MIDPNGTDLTTPQKRGELYRVMDDGRYMFFFDHSTITNFGKCPTLFNYLTLQNYRRKGGYGVPVNVGSWWSKVMEYFYTFQPVLSGTEGTIVPRSVADIIACAGRAWVEGIYDEMEKTDPVRYAKFAMPMSRDEVARSLGQQSADVLMSFYEEKERPRTALPIGPILMAVKYYNYCHENDYRDWRIIAAERAFGRYGEVMIGEDDEVVVYYMGKPDLVVYDHANNLLMPVDHKTKDGIDKNIETIWKPHSQTQGYIFAVNSIAKQLGYDVIVDRCVINVAARLEPGPTSKRQSRFHRVRPHYNQAEMLEWRDDIMLKATNLKHALQRSRFERHDTSCHLYGGCYFRDVCSRPPSNRDLVLKTDFVKTEPWSPYEED
jgi:hypothetical protein